MRTCSKCNIKKSLEDFPKNIRCFEGREFKCKACNQLSRRTPERIANQKRLTALHYQENKEIYLDRQAIRYLSDPEKFRAYGRQYQKDHPEVYKASRHKRRAKIRSCEINDLTSEQVSLLLDNFKFCIYCSSKEMLSIDHVIPISRGGANTLSNLVVACKKCNNSKRARDVNDFLVSNE